MLGGWIGAASAGVFVAIGSGDVCIECCIDIAVFPGELLWAQPDGVHEALPESRPGVEDFGGVVRRVCEAAGRPAFHGVLGGVFCGECGGCRGVGVAEAV